MSKRRTDTRNASISKRQVATRPLSSRSDARRTVLISLVLVAITLIAYWRVLDCGFLESYDDHFYVTQNRFVTQGLRADGVRWAFQTFHSANWHPLTWISHMVDCQLYQLEPRGHHLTNLLLHIANALLLFFVLGRMTGSVWRSAFVAAIFAVHPLHVESVAWVAERKDLLSTLFWLLTMHAYVFYTKCPSKRRYALVIAAYALGLMAKPMLVTLPLVLLLLDCWPLDRVGLRWRLLWEKLPLLALSAASCVVTVLAQHSGGAVASLQEVPIGQRALNSAVSYVAYIVKMIWPSKLSVFYPYPAPERLLWEGIGAALLLVVATVLAVRFGRQRRYVVVGWLWYVITLVPVIGLVQVGGQAMADRYTYMTLTGLLIIVAWGVPDLLAWLGRSSKDRHMVQVCVVGVVLVVVLVGCTRSEVEHWRDSYTLFSRAIEINPRDHFAYSIVGEVLNEQASYIEAVEYLTKAVDLCPADSGAQMNLGAALFKLGRTEDGFSHLHKALSLGLDVPELHHNLAFGYWRLGRTRLAIEELTIALRLDPTYAVSHNLFGAILGGEGKLDEAIGHWELAAEQDPRYPDPHVNLALARFNKGDCAAAWREVHILERMGRTPDPALVESLSQRMPEPSK